MPIIKNKLTPLGEQIRAIAKANNINLQEMAGQLGIDKQTITNICRGVSRPSMKLLENIAQRYGKRLLIMFIDQK